MVLYANLLQMLFKIQKVLLLERFFWPGSGCSASPTVELTCQDCKKRLKNILLYLSFFYKICLWLFKTNLPERKVSSAGFMAMVTTLLSWPPKYRMYLFSVRDMYLYMVGTGNFLSLIHSNLLNRENKHKLAKSRVAPKAGYLIC